MDQTWTKPWYQLNVPRNFNWGVVNALNGGQSIFDISKGAIEASKEQGFDYSFYFFNKYAGQIYPDKATDAFCSLHKGLDAADTIAYPEAVFGPARRGNVDRMLKICASFSKYGAAVDDKYALTLNQVRQRDTQKGFNDVGWDIWPDKVIPVFSIKSMQTRNPFLSGESGAQSPRILQSIRGLREALRKPLEKMLCISSLMTASL